MTRPIEPRPKPTDPLPWLCLEGHWLVDFVSCPGPAAVIDITVGDREAAAAFVHERGLYLAMTDTGLRARLTAAHGEDERFILFETLDELAQLGIQVREPG